MNLQDFLFPITERAIAVHNGEVDLIDLENKQTFLSGDFKAIVREDTNKLISIVRNSYQVVPNEVLINKLMHELVALESPFRIDPSHSFCENNRFRLQITFPDLSLKDSESDIPISLFLHNSYDMSEGIRVFFGAIRSICSNGMVFSNVLAKFYGKHTQNFKIENITSKLREAYDYLPDIQDRINQLEMTPVGPELFTKVENEISKRIAREVETEEQISSWQLLNRITYIISHSIALRHRARYQQNVSRVFGL